MGMGIKEIIGDKREAVLQLAAQHGAYNIRVFGSVARGEATAESDIDFLVNWDYERISSWGGIGFIQDLEALLQRKVDVVSEKWLHSALRPSILRDAIFL